MVSGQGSLFDQGTEVLARPLGRSLERIALGDGAWLDVRRHWIAGSALLFDRLLAAVPWRSDRRRMYDRTVDVPRLIAFYDEGAVLPDPVLGPAREMLSSTYRNCPGAVLRTTGFCLYRDGRDSVAWHGDTLGRGSCEDTVVAIVSLGEARRFLLRPRPGRQPGRPSVRLTLGHGDLVVMGGSCQRTWEHSVPKTARPVGPRMSIQFRAAGVG
jgi:alkylated DNA repair dioxygenase AlkB